MKRRADVTTEVYRTGQRVCYDRAGLEVPCAGTGQDGEFRAGTPWPAPRFRDMPPGVVADMLTGLAWTSDANPAEWPRTWEAAGKKINDMNVRTHLGRSDWRIPDRWELRSLLCHQETRPPLPTGHPFRNVFHGWYWTGTTVADHEGYAWYVHMGGGRTFYGAKESAYLLWPVSGPERRKSAPVQGPRFLPEGPAVRDRRTGILWARQATPAAGAVTWEEALRAVRDLNGRGGKLRWRMPNISELESLVDLRQFGPALPAGHPFEGIGGEYWSSTTSTYDPGWAWALYFHKGAVGVGRKDFARFGVWPLAEKLS